MRALVYHGPGQRAWEEVPVPEITDEGDAIVRVDATTICGTDLHILAGDVPEVRPGRILGHEAVGTVDEVGDDVHRLSPGDRVLVSCISGCGTCRSCREGRYGQCAEGGGWVLGRRIDGTQAEYVRVPYADTSTYRIPDGVSDEAILMLADILPTGYEVGVLAGGVRPGDVVAVVGGGPVGQLAALAAQSHGAAVVVVSDPVPARRESAAAQGAVPCEPAGARPLLDAVTDGRGADVVVEAVGGSHGLDAALDLVRDAGVVVSVSAHQQQDWAFPLARSFAGQRTVRFVIGDSIALRDTLTAVVTAGLVDPGFVLTARDLLDEAPRRYRDMRDLSELKVLLDVREHR